MAKSEDDYDDEILLAALFLLLQKDFEKVLSSTLLELSAETILTAEIVADPSTALFLLEQKLAQEFTATAATLTAGYHRSGDDIAKALAKHFGQSFSFDRLDTSAIFDLESSVQRFVNTHVQTQMDAVRHALTQSALAGETPAATAAAAQRALGLTPREVDAVAAYRASLENTTATALNRQLRDRRADSSVQAARRKRIPLAPEKIDGLVNRYRQNLILHRAALAAQAEALAAAHAAATEAYRQATLLGMFDEEQVVRVWGTRGDELVRGTHRPMNGQVRKVGETFLSGASVPLRYPGDPEAPVGEIINCRCLAPTKILL